MAPPDYRIRRATLADADALVHHRLAMFTDMVGMGVADENALGLWLMRVQPQADVRQV